MKFTQQLRYTKDSDATIKMFGDRAYFERKFAALDTHSFSVDNCESSDDAIDIKMSIEMPMSVPLPGFAKKFVGDTTTLVERDQWNLDTKTGRIDVDLKGVPVDVSGQMSLADEGDGSVNTIDWTVSCGIPLVGKKLEKLIADDIMAKGAEDERVSNEILADY